MGTNYSYSSGANNFKVIAQGSGLATGAATQTVASFVMPALTTNQILYVELSNEAVGIVPIIISLSATDNTTNSFCKAPDTNKDSELRTEITAAHNDLANPKKSGYTLTKADPFPVLEMDGTVGFSLASSRTLYVVYDSHSGALGSSYWRYFVAVITK